MEGLRAKRGIAHQALLGARFVRALVRLGSPSAGDARRGTAVATRSLGDARRGARPALRAQAPGNDGASWGGIPSPRALSEGAGPLSWLTRERSKRCRACLWRC